MAPADGRGFPTRARVCCRAWHFGHPGGAPWRLSPWRGWSGRLVGSGIAAAIKGGCAAGPYGCARHGMRAPAGRRVPRATRPLWPGSRQSERDGCGAAGRLERTGCRCGGRHGLAIQDTSAVHFRTAEERRRGLGEIGHGTIHGLLVHALLALDAATGSGLGLVGGRVWTRSGPVTVTHNRRAVADTASERWIATALRAKDVLAAATMVTAIADRASELDAQWAMVPAPNFHLLTRVMPDPRLANGVGRYATGARVPAADTRTIARPRRAPDEPGRTARLTLRFGTVAVKRSRSSARDLPPCVRLTRVAIVERDPPAGVEPLHWRRLTTHAVPSVAAAWQIVAWDKLRWVIEQLFRILKTQGLHLEDSQIASAERRLKLATIAPPRPPRSPSRWCRPVTGAATNRPAWPSPRTRWRPWRLSTRRSRAEPRSRKILISGTASPGPPGSSRVWAAGTAIAPPGRQVPSPSSMAWNTSGPSL